MITVEAEGISDTGKVRKSNEDTLFCDPGLRLFIVADGMGGHECGDVASKLVVDTISDRFKNFRETEYTGPNREIFENLSPDAKWIYSEIFNANLKVFKASHSNDSCRKMGSTISAVYLTENTIIAANVGDSPIFLIRNNELITLFNPHTLYHEKKALGLKNDNTPLEEDKHILTRAMGINESVDIDICEIQSFKDDVLIICSDGLSNKIAEEELVQLLSGHSLDTACQIFVDIANERGGEDNISIILIKIKGEGINKSGIIGWLNCLKDLFMTAIKK